MNLFDPSRPKLPNSRPTWLRNHIAIPHLEIFPLENGNLEASIWLPTRDETFASKRFSKILSTNEFLDFLSNFRLDPEKTCEELFSHSEPDLTPELRNHIRFEPNPDEDKKSPSHTSHVTPSRKKTKSPQITNLEF